MIISLGNNGSIRLFYFFLLLKHVYMYDIGSGNYYHSSESYATYADDVVLQF